MVRVPKFQSDSYWVRQSQATYIYSILKPYGQNFRSPVTLLLSEAKPSYVYSILKPQGQSSKSPVKPLSCQAKLSYVHTILKNIISPELFPSSCVAQRVLPSTTLKKQFNVLICLIWFGLLIAWVLGSTTSPRLEVTYQSECTKFFESRFLQSITSLENKKIICI